MSNDELREAALSAHRAKKGKVEVVGKVQIREEKDLSLYYTPGVAFPCLEINRDKSLSYEYTSRGNTVAIITDGTRILGLGNIGPEAGMPVMEGKAVLLKKFGGVDAIPLAIGEHDEDRIVALIKALEPSFGAINLEDLETPKAINVLRKLESTLSIPIFHDDSYGTGIITYAGLKNALKVVGKKIGDVKIVVNGVGSAGIGIVRVLIAAGAKNIIMCDTAGSLYKGRAEDMNQLKTEVAEITNAGMFKGGLGEAVKGADVLIGVSRKGAFTREHIGSMAERPIVFALANPDPEIEYDDARAAGAAVMATGKSGVKNQVNNMLAFPGFFRGLLDSRAPKIVPEMLVDAADAIANSVGRLELNAEYIVPDFNNQKAATKTTAKVAEAVVRAAVDAGVAGAKIDPKESSDNFRRMVKRYSRIEKLIGKL